MLKLLLNLVIAKYRYFPVSRRSINYLPQPSASANNRPAGLWEITVGDILFNLCAGVLLFTALERSPWLQATGKGNCVEMCLLSTRSKKFPSKNRWNIRIFLSEMSQQCGNKHCSIYIPGDSPLLCQLQMFLTHWESINKWRCSQMSSEERSITSSLKQIIFRIHSNCFFFQKL